MVCTENQHCITPASTYVLVVAELRVWARKLSYYWHNHSSEVYFTISSRNLCKLLSLLLMHIIRKSACNPQEGEDMFRKFPSLIFPSSSRGRFPLFLGDNFLEIEPGISSNSVARLPWFSASSPFLLDALLSKFCWRGLYDVETTELEGSSMLGVTSVRYGEKVESDLDGISDGSFKKGTDLRPPVLLQKELLVQFSVCLVQMLDPSKYWLHH